MQAGAIFLHWHSVEAGAFLTDCAHQLRRFPRNVSVTACCPQQLRCQHAWCGSFTPYSFPLPCPCAAYRGGCASAPGSLLT